MVPDIIQVMGEPERVVSPAGLERIGSLISRRRRGERKNEHNLVVRKEGPRPRFRVKRNPLDVMKSGGDPTPELR